MASNPPYTQLSSHHLPNFFFSTEREKKLLTSAVFFPQGDRFHTLRFPPPSRHEKREDFFATRVFPFPTFVKLEFRFNLFYLPRTPFLFVFLCRRCNLRKGNRAPTAWGKFEKRSETHPSGHEVSPLLRCIYAVVKLALGSPSPPPPLK